MNAKDVEIALLNEKLLMFSHSMENKQKQQMKSRSRKDNGNSINTNGDTMNKEQPAVELNIE